MSRSSGLWWEAGSGSRCSPCPLTTWGDWVAEHPDTTVLSLDTGVYSTSAYLHEDNLRSIYSDYRRAADTMFPVPFHSDFLAVKELVFGLVFGGRRQGVPGLGAGGTTGDQRHGRRGKRGYRGQRRVCLRGCRAESLREGRPRLFTRPGLAGGWRDDP